MDPIILKTFKGRVPRVTEKLLPEGYAQTATNCDLRRGKLEPLKTVTNIVSTYGAGSPFSGVTNLIRISRDLAVTNPYAWIAASSSYPNAKFVRAQISNSDNRIYATADNASYPRQINSTMYTAGSGWARLGMIAPTTALAMEITGEPDSGTTEIASFEGCAITQETPNITLPEESTYTFKVDDIVEITGASSEADNGTYALTSWGALQLQVDRNFVETDSDVDVVVSRQNKAQVDHTVSYVYTRVVKWDDGSEEESAPSSPSDPYDIYEGQGVKLTGFVKGTGTGNAVTHFRIYRLESGTDGAEYQYLGEIASVSDATDHFDDDIYGIDGETAHGLLDVQDDILETTDWEPPPATLQGLTQFANGILAGFVKNKLYLSVPWVGYAWPDGYTLTFDYNIVALAVNGESLIVLTQGFPYVVTGVDPQSMTQQILPYEQPCVSRDGVVVTNDGVIYPSPDGLFFITSSAGKLLTKDVYTKEQWAALTPSNLIAFFYDDQYIGFSRSTGTGILFNFKENPYVVDISISGGAITGGFLDPEADTLYLVNGSYLVSWGTGSALTFTWKSAVFRSGEAANYARAAVVADGTVTFVLYADGASKHTKSVTTEEAFPLPGGYRAREFEFSLSGAVAVDSVSIGQHSGEAY